MDKPNFLTAIERVIINGRPYRKCICACGNTITAREDSLKSNKTRSCGCLNRRNAVTHGLSYTPEYSVYRGLLQRCYNTKHQNYPYYGGRGIKVCERWLGEDGPTNFYSDVGPRPSPEHTIDRKDNNGDYEPGNCKWATKDEQYANRSNNRIIVFEDRTQTLAQWAEELKMDWNTLAHRLDILHWSIEKALTTSVRTYRKH